MTYKVEVTLYEYISSDCDAHKTETFTNVSLYEIDDMWINIYCDDFAAHFKTGYVLSVKATAE